MSVVVVVSHGHVGPQCSLVPKSVELHICRLLWCLKVPCDILQLCALDLILDSLQLMQDVILNSEQTFIILNCMLANVHRGGWASMAH